MPTKATFKLAPWAIAMAALSLLIIKASFTHITRKKICKAPTGKARLYGLEDFNQLKDKRSGRIQVLQTMVLPFRQVQVGFGKPPQFVVEIKNNCPMCPVTEIHVRCGNFSQNLVDPRMLKVLRFDDCVVNGGLPVAPMQKLSFNYTHQKFQLMPKIWNFQCE